ncbi:MAG TPA: hypothetical protein VMC09_18365 [Anaerolineales bacterium]|nr:hypothetical protein [Anaerolineales bacterium]
MRDLLKRLGTVFAYAVAMAWVESAVVEYLRVLIGRTDPYQINPLPVSVGLGWIEVGREVATLVMLWAVGWLAGRTWRGRAGYSLIAFGVWDIFYYIFLVPMSGWPHSLLDWDVLFLVPLPWWGPILAPILISLLLIVGGVLAALGERTTDPVWPRGWAWLLNIAGVGLALYTFMASALHVLGDGSDAVRKALPVSFNWPLFIVALALLAVPVAEMGWKLGSRRRKKAA